MAPKASPPPDEIPLDVLRKRNLPPEPPKDDKCISSRVWIGEVPYTTTKRQILQAVRAEGGVREITKGYIKIPLPGGGSKMVAIFSVVFSSNLEAWRFIVFTIRYGIVLQPEGWVGPSGWVLRDRPPFMDRIAYAYPITAWDDRMLWDHRDLYASGCTRVWVLYAVPKTAVWFVLNCIGLKDIVHATYNDLDSALQIEFVSVNAAVAAKNRVLQYGFPYLQDLPIFTNNKELIFCDWRYPVIYFVPDECDGTLHELLEEPFYTPKLSDSEFIDRFSVLPYNINWPLWYHPCMDHASVPHRTLDQQWSLLKSRDYIKRNSWSWDVPEAAQEAVKYLMHSITDPEWRATWTRWFDAETWRSDNLGRLYHYGEVVKHRQEMKCMCPGGCGYGCDLKQAPVPQVVQDFLDGRIDATDDMDEEDDSVARGPRKSGTAQPQQPDTDRFDLLAPVAKFLAYCDNKYRRTVEDHVDAENSESESEQAEHAITPEDTTPELTDPMTNSSPAPSTASDSLSCTEDILETSLESDADTALDVLGRSYGDDLALIAEPREIADQVL